ncbi:hypothetical protein [Xanthomonas sacchari]|uniref:hypothetical protein n=1 Tax=Xanthomonas sacchari TaxID=56458 RepID=UPI0035284AA6
MTWYADEIILRASDAALKAISASSHLAPFAYHIQSLDGHEWYRQEQLHALPDGGLLMIRPVCGRSSHGVDWHGVAALDWAELPFDSIAEVLLDTSVTQQLSEYLDEESMPPLQLRKAIASLAAHLKQPVLYYSCGMWGGSIDYEYSLVYEPLESVVLTRSSLQSDGLGTEDSLRTGLAKIGLNLPTTYFAPHTRSYPWQLHKLR